MFLIKYEVFQNLIKNNILKYLLLSFVSNKLMIIKKIIELNDNYYVNYNLIYNQSLIKLL